MKDFARIFQLSSEKFLTTLSQLYNEALVNQLFHPQENI